MRLSVEVESQEGMTWEEFVTVARTCEAAGIHGLYRSDHYRTFLAPQPLAAHDSWTSLAAIATQTESIRLGTIVSSATFRHPSVLARMVATIDHISGGRVDVGVGAGWNEREHVSFGFPYGTLKQRFARLAEQVEIMVGSWTQDSFDFEGEYYTLVGAEAMPKPVQRPHPPIILGGFAQPRGAALAARWAQEYNSVYATVEECRERRANLDRACRDIGRDPETLPFALQARCTMGRDRAEAQERIDRMRALDPDFESEVSASPHGLESALVGTVDEVATRLSELEAAGVSHVVLHHIDHRDMDLIELVGSELLPTLA
jgi:F420-dependent oxidoreductase-like protein